MAKLQFETTAVYQNFRGDDTNSIVRGIHPSTAFIFNDADHGADLFDLKVAGNIYTRLTNPSNDALGQLVSDLEGGVGGLSFSSGSAAITLAILNIVKTGDHILASRNLYGGTISLFNNTFKPLGIDVTYIDNDLSYEEIKKLVQPNTKLLFGETIGNPLVNVLDYEKYSKLAKEVHIPFLVDNTFTPAYLFKPLEHGANIVIHSATKYLGGHGNALGGIVVDGGNFDWTKDDKYPDFTTPNEAYHGIVYSDVFKEAAYIYKLRTQGLRDIGATISPFNAFIISQGIQTLHLRLDRASSNALELAKYLEKHPKIEWVSYPLLESSKDYARAKEYFPKGASGILCFGIKGGLEAGKTFINNVSLAIHAVNVGDVRTIVTHPASTTHRQLSEDELIASGITSSLIRISVGIESIEDLINDIEEALAKVK